MRALGTVPISEFWLINNAGEGGGRGRCKTGVLLRGDKVDWL